MIDPLLDLWSLEIPLWQTWISTSLMTLGAFYIGIRVGTAKAAFQFGIYATRLKEHIEKLEKKLEEKGVKIVKE
jgi:hypothetical protein